MTKFMRRAQETGKELAFEAVRQALDSSNMRIEDIESVAMGSAPDAFDGVHMKGEYLLDGAGGWRKPYSRNFVGGGAAGCVSPGGTVVFHNNSWDTNPSDSDCDGTGDVYGDPDLNIADFSVFTYANQPSPTDFEPQSGSNTENAGFDLDTTILSTSNYPLYTEITVPDSTFDLTELGYDYLGNARHATTPDIGALEIGGAPAPPSVETVTTGWGMNIGGGAIGPLASGRSYETEQYRTADTSPVSYTDLHSDAVAGTADDALYQTWRGKNGTMTWSIPIDDATSPNVNVEFQFAEQYWGDETGTCVGGERRFNLLIDGVIVNSEFDPCLIAGAPNTAVIYTESNIAVGTDDKVVISVQPRTSGTLDNKGELSGIYIIDYSGAGDTLSVANSTITPTIINQYPSSSVIDVATLSGADTTSGNPIIPSVITGSCTSGSIVIALYLDNTVQYTPVDGNSSGSVCSVTVTLSD